MIYSKVTKAVFLKPLSFILSHKSLNVHELMRLEHTISNKRTFLYITKQIELVFVWPIEGKFMFLSLILLGKKPLRRLKITSLETVMENVR